MFLERKAEIVKRVTSAALSVAMLGSILSTPVVAFASGSNSNLGISDSSSNISLDSSDVSSDGVESDAEVVTPPESSADSSSSSSSSSENGMASSSTNSGAESSSSSSGGDSENSSSTVESEPTPTPEPVATQNPDTTADGEEKEDSDTEFSVLGIVPVENYALTAAVGDEVELSVNLNREDVQVNYQWQKKYLSSGVKSDKELHNYGDAPTFYNFVISDKTEAEILADDPGKTWAGIELYQAAKTALENIGEDTTKLTFAWRTRNFALEGFSIRAEKVGETVYIYAENEAERFTATLNADGEYSFDEGVSLTEVQTQPSTVDNWVNIDGATSDKYSFIFGQEDFNANYRCVVTIVDETYKAECMEWLKQADSLPNEEQQQAEQILYTPIYEFSPEYSEDMIVPQDSWLDSYAMLGGKNIVGNPQLSSDNQWITGLTGSYEYITKDTYDRVSKWVLDGSITQEQADLYWTKLGTNGFNTYDYANVLDENGFPVGKKVRQYRGFDLTNGMLEVNSEWYGKTVYFRPEKDGRENWYDVGTAINIPAYTDITSGNAGTLYKKAISFLNPYVYDTGAMYSEYISMNTTSAADPRGAGWLTQGAADGNLHIQTYTVLAQDFNADPERYLMDAEGNYRMDSVGWGVCTGEEPDLSGKAYWVLKDFISNGYGFIIGHDTMYAYAGAYYDAKNVPLDESSIDPNDTITWYYDLNSWMPGTRAYQLNEKHEIIAYSDTRGGHFYVNQLMGSNSGNVYSGTTSPSDAPSLILSAGGSHGIYGKTSMYGGDVLNLVQKGYSEAQAASNPKYRTPTNYPYGIFNGVSQFPVDMTHSNGQFAFGSIWVNYANNKFGQEAGHTSLDEKVHYMEDMSGTNNFYLSGSGNFLMNQIGHFPTNSATMSEAKLFSNSIYYVSQRKQCEVCAANQAGQQTAHFVHRINSVNAKQILSILQSGGNYWYSLDDCYMLTEDIVLPEDWKAIANFNGHWNSDVYDVQLPSSGEPLLKNDSADGASGWNLGTNPKKGVQTVFDGNMTRTTGVARVLGDLNALFGTDNVNYANYTVKILGSDNPSYMSANESYTCTVNSDSKYVISNLPCIYDTKTKTGILKARVYDTTGREVTEYGTIKVNVDKAFWDNDMTIPLYLGSFSADPVQDTVTYESAQARFVAVGYSDEAISVTGWQYKDPKTSTWTNVPESWNISVQNTNGTDGDLKTVTSTLILKDVNPAWNNYEFRAVFSNSHGSWNTYRYYWSGGQAWNDKPTSQPAAEKVLFKTGYYGKLSVKLLPVYTQQGENQTVYEGRSATFQSKGYGLADGSKITAQWQYSTRELNNLTGQYELKWHDVSGSNEFGKLEKVTTNCVLKPEINSDIEFILTGKIPYLDKDQFKKNTAFYEVTTSLTVNKVDISQTDMHFRVKYSATTKYGTKYEWYSNVADDFNGKWVNQDLSACTDVQSFPLHKGDYSNILTVKMPELDVVTAKSYDFDLGRPNVDTMTPDEYGQMLILPSGNYPPTGVHVDGTAAYQVTIYYLPGDIKPTPKWQYITFKDRIPKDWNQSVASGISSKMTTKVSNSSPTLVQSGAYKGYYSFTSTLTITNPPLSMYDSSNFEKYFFRCLAQVEYDTVRNHRSMAQVDQWGGLSMDYSISIHHNGILTYGGKNIINGKTAASMEDIIEFTKGSYSSTWMYPNLSIEIPDGRKINTVIIYFEGSHHGSDAIEIVNRSEIENRGVKIQEHSANNKLVLVSNSKNSVETSTWHEILRNYIRFNVYDSVDYANGATGGAKIRWYVDENQYDGLTIDPNTGHGYRIFHSDTPISWDDAKWNVENVLDSQYDVNGYLVSINNENENNIVKGLVGSNEAWLGGSNLNGGWVWSDGSALNDYTAWKGGAEKGNKYLYMEGGNGWNSTNGTSQTTGKYTFTNKIPDSMHSHRGTDMYRTTFKRPSGFSTYIQRNIHIENGYVVFFINNLDPITTTEGDYIYDNLGQGIPLSVFTHGGNSVVSVDGIKAGNRVYYSPQTIQFDSSHIYYMQVVPDSYGDNNGRLVGGIFSDSGWIPGTTWEQSFNQTQPNGLSGGDYNNIQRIIRNTNATGVVNFWATGQWYDGAGVADGADATMCQYAIIDLTETFGSNENFKNTLNLLGYNADDDQSIIDFMNNVVNPNGEKLCSYEEQYNPPAYAVSGIRRSAEVDITSEVRKDIYWYVGEFDIGNLSIRGTNHSASDSDRIGTNAKGTPGGDKELVVYISGNEKVYDGEQIVPSEFYVTGSVGASNKLVQITYKAPEGENKTGYRTRTVNGEDWEDTRAVNATYYTVEVSLAPGVTGWKISPYSSTECELVVRQRPINVYSYQNDKVYDGTSNGTIKNIQMEPYSKVNQSGVVPNDTVSLTRRSVPGFYLDSQNRLAIHNSLTNNNNVDYKMQRDSTATGGDLDISHSVSSDRYYNYKLGTETYSGGITQKGLYIHSIYLEDKNYPRNVKEYDGTTAATVSDIIIDGVVAGDTITLQQESLDGLYNDHNAGENLDSQGKPLPEREKKLKEVEIFLTEQPKLKNNNFNDYFIQREKYSGAIYRAELEAHVKSWSGIYGTGMKETPWHDTKPYDKTGVCSDGCWLDIGGLKHMDTLLLNSKSYFEVDGLGKNAKVEPDTPVGTYPITYIGLNETNYSVLKNYFVTMYDGKLNVAAREIVISVNNSDKMVGDKNPAFFSTFSLKQDDNSLVELGSDETKPYKDMVLAVPQDTIESVVKVKSKTDNSLSNLVMGTDKISNIPYVTDCDVDSKPIYNLGGDYSTYKCEFCEKYHGFELGTDHWTMGAYAVDINKDISKGNILEVASVQNSLGENVQNYSLTIIPGELTVHPELRFQLKAEVPMYVCMYGYASDGEIIEPTEYGITNYSNGAIKITNIAVGDKGWAFTKDPDKEKMNPGEIYMNMNDTVLEVGDNKPNNPEDWRINKDSSTDGSGTFLRLPIFASMAGNEANALGEHFIAKVTYTVDEYGLTVPTGVIDDENVTIIDGKPVNPEWNPESPDWAA